MSNLLEETVEKFKKEITTATKKRDDLTASIADQVAEHDTVIKDLERALKGITGKAPRAKGSGGGGRPAGGGKTQQKVMDHVGANPGSKTGDIATALGIKPNYLYRVLPGLVDSGQIVKNVDGSYTATVTAAPADIPANAPAPAAEPVTA